MKFEWNKEREVWIADLGIIKLYIFQKEEGYIGIIKGAISLEKKPRPTLDSAIFAIEESVVNKLRNILGLNLQEYRLEELEGNVVKLNTTKPDKILALIKQSDGGLSMNQLIEATGYSRTSITNFCSLLINQGKLSRGLSSNDKSFIYYEANSNNVLNFVRPITPGGVTFKVLQQLSLDTPKFARDIAIELNKPRNQVNALLSKLEKTGHVIKVVAPKKDFSRGRQSDYMFLLAKDMVSNIS